MDYITSIAWGDLAKIGATLLAGAILATLGTSVLTWRRNQIVRKTFRELVVVEIETNLNRLETIDRWLGKLQNTNAEPTLYRDRLSKTIMDSALQSEFITICSGMEAIQAGLSSSYIDTLNSNLDHLTTTIVERKRSYSDAVRIIRQGIVPAVGQTQFTLLVHVMNKQNRFVSNAAKELSRRFDPVRKAKAMNSTRVWRSSFYDPKESSSSQIVIAWENDEADAVPTSVQLFVVSPPRDMTNIDPLDGR